MRMQFANSSADAHWTSGQELAPPALLLTRPTVHLVDPDPGFRTELELVLRSASYWVRSYGCAAEFLHSEPQTMPGCVLLDLRLPDSTGLELQQEMAQRGILLPVIFLTDHGDLQVCVQAVRAGALDFLAKPASSGALLSAIDKAVKCEADLRAERTLRHDASVRWGTLTRREREVMEWVLRGMLNKVIANETGMAERTVKAHRAHAMEKMQCRSLVELVRTVDSLDRHCACPVAQIASGGTSKRLAPAAYAIPRSRPSQ